MDTATIIAELESQKYKLDQAIAALNGSSNHRGRGRHRLGNGRKRHLSAAARKKIGDAARKRWAKVKAAGKSSL